MTNVLRNKSVASYEVRITDPYGREVIRMDQFRRIDLSRKINDVGQMNLTIPDRYPDYLFGVDYRVELWRKSQYAETSTLEGETAWFIRKNEIILDSSGERKREITAHDANHILGRRIVPYNKGNSLLNADKVQEADDMMKAIVRENFGSLALDSNRDIGAYLGVQGDYSLAPQVYKSFSRKVVLDVLQDIAETSYDLGTFLAFDTIYDPLARKFEFRTYIGQRGVDRTGVAELDALVVGPEYGTLSNVSILDDQDDSYNYVYAGGQSIGEIRAVAETSDPVSIALSPFNRIEHFENASNTDDEDELQDAADAALEAGRPRIRFSGNLSLTYGLSFGKNISFGDRVLAEYKKNQYPVWIESYSLRIEGGKDTYEVVLKSE